MTNPLTSGFTWLHLYSFILASLSVHIVHAIIACNEKKKMLVSAIFLFLRLFIIMYVARLLNERERDGLIKRRVVPLRQGCRVYSTREAKFHDDIVFDAMLKGLPCILYVCPYIMIQNWSKAPLFSILFLVTQLESYAFFYLFIL